MKEFYGKKDTLSAWRYGKDMLAGIQHIHTHGIIHNDIKLENCVVMPNGNLMLIDFGLSSYAKRRREDQASTIAALRVANPTEPHLYVCADSLALHWRTCDADVQTLFLWVCRCSLHPRATGGRVLRHTAVHGA